MAGFANRTSGPGEHVVDARMLEPPEPFVRVMEALDEIDQGRCESIVLLLYREPFPLYKALTDNGYSWTTRHDADGTYVIRIGSARGCGDASASQDKP